MKISEIIEKTARQVVAELKRQEMLTDSKQGTFQKTEKALYTYYQQVGSKEMTEETKKFCTLIERAIATLYDEPYFDILPLKYGENLTFEKIAEFFQCDVSTITRTRKKLINKLRPIIFSDDFIRELYNL